MNSNYTFSMTQEDGTVITVSGPGGISWHEMTQQFVYWLKGCSYHLPEGDAELIFDDNKPDDPISSLVELEAAVYEAKEPLSSGTKVILLGDLEELIEYIKELKTDE
jgi:hypothetical protein